MFNKVKKYATSQCLLYPDEDTDFLGHIHLVHAAQGKSHVRILHVQTAFCQIEFRTLPPSDYIELSDYIEILDNIELSDYIKLSEYRIIGF